MKNRKPTALEKSILKTTNDVQAMADRFFKLKEKKHVKLLRAERN